jgi:hypothetical protein
MWVEIHDHLGHPIRLPATRVVILQSDGTLSAFALEFQPGHIRHFRCGDTDFNEQAHAAGINRTVLVTSLKPQDLKVLT